MQDVGHVNHETAQAVSAALAKSPAPTAAEQEAEFVLQWYKDNYDFVQSVHCQGCDSLLCLWVLEPNQVKQNTHIHPQGLRRIEMGDQILATRKRYDGVVGYQCKCGADSTIAEVEKEYVTQSSTHIPADAPHIAALVQRKIVAQNWRPKVEEHDDEQNVEGFLHRRVK